MAKKISKKDSAAAASTSSKGAPKPPSAEELPVTDPRRKLSKEERAALTPEQRKERRANLRSTRGPAKDRFSKRLGKVERLLTAYALRLGGTEASESAEAAVKAVRNLRADIAELPDDWKPAGGLGAGNGEPKFSEGEKVVLREKKRAMYQDLLDGDFHFIVKKVAGKQVMVTNKAKASLVFRQADLQRASEA